MQGISQDQSWAEEIKDVHHASLSNVALEFMEKGFVTSAAVCDQHAGPAGKQVKGLSHIGTVNYSHSKPSNDLIKHFTFQASFCFTLALFLCSVCIFHTTRRPIYEWSIFEIMSNVRRTEQSGMLGETEESEMNPHFRQTLTAFTVTTL